MPTDREAAEIYAAAILRAQAVLAEWVADHDRRITGDEEANRVLEILDSRNLVAFQRARGEAED